MRIVDVPQGSEEWRRLRAGKITASRLGDLTAKIKTGEAAARRDYRVQLIAEILTGEPQEDDYVSKEMLWGIEQEEFARAAYEATSNCFVDKVGFILHPDLDYAGASPDGLVGTDGGVQIKCPKTATHLATLMDGAIPREHLPQMHWELACSGRDWWDFVSYDPRLPSNLRLFTKRLQRDDAAIGALTKEVVAFKAELDRHLATIKRFA